MAGSTTPAEQKFSELELYGPGIQVLDAWDHVTGEDLYDGNVTMLQLRAWPYTLIELWWESGGKIRCCPCGAWTCWDAAHCRSRRRTED